MKKNQIFLILLFSLAIFAYFKFFKNEEEIPKAAKIESIYKGKQILCQKDKVKGRTSLVSIDWNSQKFQLFTFSFIPKKINLKNFSPTMEGEIFFDNKVLELIPNEETHDKISTSELIEDKNQNILNSFKISGQIFNIQSCPWHPESPINKFLEREKKDEIAFFCANDLKNSLLLDKENGKFSSFGSEEPQGINIFENEPLITGKWVKKNGLIILFQGEKDQDTLKIKSENNGKIIELEKDSLIFSTDNCFPENFSSSRKFLCSKIVSQGGMTIISLDMEKKEILLWNFPDLLPYPPQDPPHERGNFKISGDLLSLNLKNSKSNATIEQVEKNTNFPTLINFGGDKLSGDYCTF